MLEYFEEYITAQAAFTKAELQRLLATAAELKVRRKQFILQEGEVCRRKIFVCKGLLRTYLTKEDGTESIMRFSCENLWAIDPQSYNSQKPSRYNIEAMEDSDLLVWDKEVMDELFETIPAFRDYGERLKENSLDESQNRILANISYTAEEKYHEFIEAFPDVFRRVPLHMVASYLGVSRETLSRIRHAQRAQP